MKITGMQVGGFGVWSGLKLEGLSDGINVLYGPNEAGKTTLLQFVRSILYGFSPARQRYFPPLRGGRPGGSLEVAGANGRFQLDRHIENENSDPQERITLTAADGTRQGEHLVPVLLSGIDETIYNNVFAVGLQEIQELGTLGDTEAAEMLYSLTAGLDRVSLVEVTRELETSRNRILDRTGRPSQVVQLLKQRETLCEEIEELGKLTRRYGRLAAAQDQLQREITRLEEENTRTENQARVIELAITLGDRWSQRAALDEELATLGPHEAMPEGAVERMDAVNERLQKHQQGVEELKRQHEELREEAAGLKINQKLARQAARIEAFGEQESWITNLQGQVEGLEAEMTEIRSALAAEREQLGLDESGSASLPVISGRTIGALRPPAAAMKQCRGDLEKAKQEVAAANEDAASLSRQVSAALSTHGESDLAEALDKAGNLVSQFRRRHQIDERLDQMKRYEGELEEQSRNLVDRQLLPVWVLACLASVFALGIMLAMVGIFTPGSITGSMGWIMMAIGLAGSGTAGFLKVVLERSNERQLDACQKQIGMLRMQIEEIKQERDSLDGQLPRGGGPIVSRLDAAEQQLASLEELLPLESRRETAAQKAVAAASRSEQAEADLAAARRRWRDALVGVGLPPKLAPRQVRQLVRRCDQIKELTRRLASRREQLDQRCRELDSLLDRLDQVVVDSGVELTARQPLAQLHELADALARQEAAVERRETLRRQARRIRRKVAKHEEALGRLRQRRRELLRDADARDEQEFRHRALQFARSEVLRRDRDALDREIAAAIGGQCPEEAIAEQIRSKEDRDLKPRRDELLDRLEAVDGQLRDRYERRGQLTEQLKILAEDRQMAKKQLDLASVEKRLEDALHDWQVLAVTCRTLQTIRTIYEKQRQPETLQEASGYLDRLTNGRYRRVWTPLDEEALRVDDAKGNSIPVEALSRGTREQLFLALRLALAASYARRGAPLPLVLDDVLVNFDAERAKAAAGVLRDFAAAGHQLLVFTCHEHILKLFKSLKVTVSRLPDNAEADPSPIVLQQPAKKSTRRRKKPEPEPVEVVEEPDDEIIVAEDDEDEAELSVAQTDDAVFEEADDDAPWDEEDEAEAEEDELDEDEEEYDEEEDEYEWEEDEEEDYDEEDYEDDAAEAA